MSFVDTQHHSASGSGTAAVGTGRLEQDSLLPDLCPVNRDDKNCFLVTREESKDTLGEPSENITSCCDTPVSFWEALVTFYMPLLFQSLCGGANVVRSIMFTYLVQTLLKPEDWGDNKIYRALMQFSSAGSWPPPALLLLAMLTLTTLVVHPEGFTWIAVRNIKNGLLYLFQSSSTCWNWVINDFGSIVSTVLALMVFGGLFFLCYVLHRTLRPRPKPEALNASSHISEKNRRKRRKGRNEKNRASKQLNSPNQTQEQESVTTTAPIIPTEQQPSTTLVDDLPSLSQTSVQHSSLPIVTEKGPAATIDSNQNAVEKKLQLRSRVESASTVDTALDISIEEASVGSASDRSTAATHSSESRDASPPTRSNRAVTRKPRTAPQPQRIQTTSRNRKGVAPHPPNTVHSKKIPQGLVPVSRWDALKPVHNGDTATGTTEAVAEVHKTSRKGVHSNHHRSTRNTKSTKPIPLPYSLDQPRTTDPMPPPRLAPLQQNVLPPDTFWTGEATIRSFDRASFTTGYTEQSHVPSTSSLYGQPQSTLNPNSPPFAPSAAPKTNRTMMALRPPPGLVPPVHKFNNAASLMMEPLQLPSSPPPGLPVLGLTLPCGSTSPSYLRPRENPFEEDDEEQIAAELQELGGQMVGSILDF